MRSSLPKVMHQVGGLAMVGHVVRTARAAGATAISVVVGPGQTAIEAEVTRHTASASFATQGERLGTAHAVREARRSFETADGNVIVLYADNPLVTTATVASIAARLDAGADIVVVGYTPDDPTNLGRLLTENGRLVAIREHRDATDEERRISLCNSGIMGFRADALRAVIDRIGNSNAKGEFYLTDAVELANADGRKVEFIEAGQNEVIGVDDRSRLARAEALFQELRRNDFMRAGVTLKDPSSVYFSYDTEIAEDVLIEPHVVMGPGVKIERGAVIHAFSHIEGAHVGPGATVGPFARLRPGADLGEKAKVGNFVEVKNATVGAGAKLPHLSYVGDAEIGAKANLGAGTITCNYDGVNKWRTVVGEGAFVGSNSSLVAPVTVGAGAYVASGSVVTFDVEPDALAVARARQVNKDGYATSIRARAESIKLAKKAKE